MPIRRYDHKDKDGKLVMNQLAMSLLKSYVFVILVSNVRLGFCTQKCWTPGIADPHFFQGEMVPWLYLRLRQSKAGGMHLIYFKDLKTGKDLNRPAARLTDPV
jgi:hypothetical protein